MTAFETARRFFEACEAPTGWVGCHEFVEADAVFAAQSEPLARITTVEAYCEWMLAFGTITAPGSTYTLHAASYDETTRTATFFATYHAVHSGEGGPVPPTHRQTHSHYVYALSMSANGKVERMVKIWNAGWAMQELGWS
ncbi:MAG: hypothetical protein ACKOBM_09430 [Gammaproteobacteria bacterium]